MVKSMTNFFDGADVHGFFLMLSGYLYFSGKDLPRFSEVFHYVMINNFFFYSRAQIHLIANFFMPVSLGSRPIMIIDSPYTSCNWLNSNRVVASLLSSLFSYCYC